MSESHKNSSSDKTPSDKPSSQAKCPNVPKPQKMSQSGNNFHSQLNSVIENLRSIFKKFLKTDLKKSDETSDLSNVVTTAEKAIRHFYGLIVKKVSDFAGNDLQKFKTMSKEETEKTRKLLLQYAASMQKTSEEKLKQLMEVKKRLKMKSLKKEELYEIAKFFEVKMTEVRKLTKELCKSLPKGETAPFVNDLQKMVENQGNAVKHSLNSFLVVAKENITNVQVTLKSLSAKDVLSKIPNNYKLPASLSNIFFQKSSGRAEGQQTSEIVKKSMVSFKNRLQFNVGKVIHSDRIYGRTKIAKATYTSVILFYLYRKFNRPEVEK